MKEVKTILFFLATAAVTSSWWAFAVFGPRCTGWTNPNPSYGVPFFMVPVILTAVLVAFIFSYVHRNWDN